MQGGKRNRVRAEGCSLKRAKELLRGKSRLERDWGKRGATGAYKNEDNVPAVGGNLGPGSRKAVHKGRERGTGRTKTT